MTSRLNQIIAVEKGIRADATRRVTDAYHMVQKSGERSPLQGISRTYRPKADDGDQLPTESTRVQYTATSAVDAVAEAWSRMWDVVATKDETNTRARADVVVNGNTVWTGVPATTLLFLEKQLQDVIAFIEKLPVLDPAERWEWDAAVGAYASAEVETTRTKKIPRNHVRSEATDKHPAQVDVYMEDVVVGYWSTRKFSGALPQDVVDGMARRARALQGAVKQAREQANMAEVTDVRGMGSALLAYVFETD